MKKFLLLIMILITSIASAQSYDSAEDIGLSPYDVAEYMLRNGNIASGTTAPTVTAGIPDGALYWQTQPSIVLWVKLDGSWEPGAGAVDPIAIHLAELGEKSYNSLDDKPLIPENLADLTEKSYNTLTDKPTSASWNLAELNEKSFASLASKPTTLNGYGIIDGVLDSVFSSHVSEFNSHVNTVVDAHSANQRISQTLTIGADNDSNAFLGYAGAGTVAVGDYLMVPYTATAPTTINSGSALFWCDSNTNQVKIYNGKTGEWLIIGSIYSVDADFGIKNESYLNLYSNDNVGENIRARLRCIGSATGSGYGGDFVLETRNGSNVWNSNAFTLKENGNILINTATDDSYYKLQLAGNAKFYSTSGGSIGEDDPAVANLFTNTPNGGGGLFNVLQLHLDRAANNDGAALTFAANDAGGSRRTLALIGAAPSDTTDGSPDGYMVFYTCAGTMLERMRLTKSGNLLINTATDDGINKLQVNGSVKFDAGSSVCRFKEITLADNQTLDLRSFFGNANYMFGNLKIVAIENSGSAADVFLTGSYNTVNLYSVAGSVVNTSTDGYICVYPAGSGEYTLENKLGTSTVISLFYQGIQ